MRATGKTALEAATVLGFMKMALALLAGLLGAYHWVKMF